MIGITRREDGYTLLEVLVATAIMALMVIPLTQGFGLGLDTWQGLHSEIAEGERRAMVRQRLEAWLSSAYALDVNRKPGAIIYPMIGSTAQIEFSVAVHPDPVKNELSRILMKTNEQDIFHVGIKPDAFAQADGVERQWHDLFESISETKFSYLEGVDQEGSPIWLSEWQSRNDLPKAVKLELEFKDESIEWRPIVAYQKIDEWAYCVLDPVSRDCRTGEIPS